MLLPKDVKRKDTKEYEEVIIPINEPPPLSVGNTRVQVSDLDEVNLYVFITTICEVKSHIRFT